MTKAVQYDAALAASYSSEARIAHPQTKMQYTTWLHVLGNVHGLRVLDLACGSGLSSRLLAAHGAQVIGVDMSEPQIGLARESELRNPLGIEYVVADAAQLNLEQKFDRVTPTHLFQYASSEEQLQAMANAAAHHLKSGGRLVGLLGSAEPIVKRLPNAGSHTEWIDEPYKEGSRARAYIYGLDGQMVLSQPLIFHYWRRSTYERCLTAAGFRRLCWPPYSMPEEGKRMFPNWKQLEENTTSAIISAWL